MLKLQLIITFRLIKFNCILVLTINIVTQQLYRNPDIKLNSNVSLMRRTGLVARRKNSLRQQEEETLRRTRLNRGTHPHLCDSRQYNYKSSYFHNSLLQLSSVEKKSIIRDFSFLYLFKVYQQFNNQDFSVNCAAIAKRALIGVNQQ